MNTFIKAIWAFIEEFFATKEEVVPISPVTSTPPPALVENVTSTVVENKYLWDTPEKARHSVRVICDEEGLSVEDKNIVTAVIHAESGFKNTAINRNKNSKGVVTSTDWGICQVNDHYHIGYNLSFPSVEYVLDNPDKVVRWMCKMHKAGLIKLWCAYTNGSYKQFLN